MDHFNKEFLRFFKELGKNNNKEWFDANRSTYEKEVKAPFHAFVTEMIARIAKQDPEVGINAGDAIGRINKDIRFSKDKTPYNTSVSANISRYGRKNKAYPGFFFQIGAEGIEIFGGAYMPEKEELQRIRELLAKDGKTFEKAIRNKEFVDRYGEIKGEKAKRLDPKLAALAAKNELVANKQFYYMAKLPAKWITENDLAEELMRYYRAGRPVNTYLQQPFK